jgi:ribose transport system permease protein
MRKGAVVGSHIIRTLVTRYGLVLAWLVVIIIFTALGAPGFLSAGNFSTIFGSQAVLLIVALALMIPATTGEFDLSVAGTLGMGMILTTVLTAEHGWPLAASIAVALLVGVIVGLVNAFLIVTVGIMSLIATLGTGTVLTGLGYLIIPSVVTGDFGVLTTITRTEFLGIPLLFYYGLALTIVLWYVYAFTALGRYLFFSGSSPEVARLAGVNVTRIRVGALLVCAVLSALAGVLLAGDLGSGSPTASASFLFPTFAAAFLGSTAVTPGRFNPWGTFIAVYFLVTGITGLQLMGYVGWVPQVFYGASLVIAVAISKLTVRSDEALLATT